MYSQSDGIFNRLCNDRFWQIIPCVLVTGKGFPDLATRAFVRKLSDLLKLPVLGLADWNPFGLGKNAICIVNLVTLYHPISIASNIQDRV